VSAEPLVYTVEQAAEILAVSRGTAYEAVRAGEIPSVRVGRCIRVPRHRLEELLGTPPNHDEPADNELVGKVRDDTAQLES
jgi:excisionase family DNA binding protein